MLDARDRWRAWRDRLLGSRDFQRWAAAFPPTRFIARKRARETFDLVAGFVYSQVLLACVRLKLLDRLRAEPADLATLAAYMRLPEANAARLLEAAVSLKLVDKRSGGRYGLGVHGAALAANPGIIAMVEHHAAFYADLADPVALLRGEMGETRLSQYWPYVRGQQPADTDGAARYTELMAASQSLVADEILNGYDFSRHRRLVDVGGGNGTFLAAVAKCAPRLELQLFDLPAVAQLAAAHLGKLGLRERIEIIGGDFRNDELQSGADVMTLVRVLHDHDDALVQLLLKKIYAALTSGGRIVVAEPLAETRGAEAMGHAYFGFYLMAMGSGRPRTFGELKSFLEVAGFENVAQIATRLPLQVSLVTAERM